ncbi:MAG TPA: glycosyltransferase family 9 protein [Candidatus Acidoferrum sp.]|jgi:heptosyltransferase I
MIKVRGNPTLHFVDRYIGIPAIAFVGSIRTKRILPANIKRIGLLKGGAIGDTVLLSAVVADLREAFPAAEIILFAGESNYEMACMLDGVDRVIKAPAGNVLKGIRAMRSAPVDVLLDFGQWTRLEALFTLASKAAFTIGFCTAEQHRHHGFDLAVEHSSTSHELENYRDLVRALGAKAIHLPALSVPKQSSGIPQSYVVFHLWPGGRRRELKQWPSDRWLRLIAEFLKDGLSVVLTGSSSDKSLNEELIKDIPDGGFERVINVAGSSLSETASLLAGARLVVSVDTGIMHIASALNLPLVAIHGPTSSKRWGPLNPRAIAVDTTLPEGGFINLGWEEISPLPACMEAVPYESVREACKLLLQNQPEQTAVPTSDEPVEVLKSAAP